MAKGRKSTLEEMSRERRPVKFIRHFEQGHVRGYVLDVGPKFFLVAIVSDNIWFNGFRCFRIIDVSNLTVDPNATFAEAALKKRGERLPKKPRIDLATIEKLLLSASRAFPLVTIHTEQVVPDVCW